MSDNEVLNNILIELKALNKNISTLKPKDKFKIKGMLSLSDAAEYVGLSIRTLYNWNNKGLLPAKRINNKVFINKLDLENIMKKTCSNNEKNTNAETVAFNLKMEL